MMKALGKVGRWWGLGLSLLLLAVLGASVAMHRRVVVWPGGGAWTPYGFSDQDHGGGSRNLFYRAVGNELSSDFILTDRAERFAGIVLNSADGLIRDCSGCSFLRMTYRTRTLDPLRVQILLDAPGRTRPGAELSKRYLFWELPPSLSWATVDIPLSEFQTPEWWFKQNYVPPALLAPPDFSRVLAVAVCESEFTPPYKTLGIDLRAVAFRSSWWRTILLACLVPLPLLVQGIWRRPRGATGKAAEEKVGDHLEKDSGERPSEISGEGPPEGEESRVKPFGNPRPVPPRDEADFVRITELIAQRYPESELTLAVISRESRIPEGRISQILDKRTGLHFKPYLNQVRIQEAVRMLLETELTVSEIAFQVGYANTTHFNRVFKGMKQVSPGEFRKAAREA